MVMNYLIFGGEGFIGFHLIEFLNKQKGIPYGDIYSLDIVEKDKTREYNYIYCDIRKEISLNIPNIKDSIIFNLAAIHTTPGHENEEYFETNILGAENITTFAENNSINKIAFTSSIAPYGASEKVKTEETIPMPNIPYGISKYVAEKIHLIWLSKDSSNRKLFMVRPGVVFGKGEGGNYSRLYSSMKKGFFFYPGRKDTIKACVYVKDVVRILYYGISTHQENPAIFNLTYFPAPTIEEICNTIAITTHINKPRILIPSWLILLAARGIHFISLFLGSKFNGIHPDRVKKVMISTNISGNKLENSYLKLRYSLSESINDWFNDCDEKGLL
jgi:nucleoside-diphosphate-sugar epimerase